MQYGRVITEIVYKNGSIATQIEKTTESVYIGNRQELLDQIFKQLDMLQDCDEVHFSVYGDKHSHEPIRMEVTVRR